MKRTCHVKLAIEIILLSWLHTNDFITTADHVVIIFNNIGYNFADAWNTNFFFYQKISENLCTVYAQKLGVSLKISPHASPPRKSHPSLNTQRSLDARDN